MMNDSKVHRISVEIPHKNENDELPQNNQNADENAALSLTLNDEENNVDDTTRQEAGLNSPKKKEQDSGMLTLQVEETPKLGSETPNTLRDKMDVNSPRNRNSETTGWAAANPEQKTGIESLITQVSREEDENNKRKHQTITSKTNLISQDDSLQTQDELKSQVESKPSGLWSCCKCLFSCCSSPPQSSSSSTSSPQTEMVVPINTPIANSSETTSTDNKKTEAPTEKKNIVSSTTVNNVSRESSTSEPSATEYTAGVLPEPLPEHKNRKCLVLDLDETLVHSSFKPVPGPDFVIPIEIENTIYRVYVKKRPYVDEFLQRCAKIYEVVVFTASLSKYANPLLDKLDVNKTVTHRLFRETCVLNGTSYVKDLRVLGRKLKNIIFVDNSPHSYAFQLQNAIPIDTWFDDMNDTCLLDLLPVLESTLLNCKDVRNILDANKSYEWICAQANEPLEKFEKPKNK